MNFQPSTLDEIRARLPVSAVVGRRVRLKRQGREWAGLSPFNKEKTPSFFVNDQKGFYHCFSSGHHGDIFRFLMETEGVSFPEAVQRLAADAGVDLPKSTPQDAEREKRRATLHEVLDLAATYFESRLQAREGAGARGYLADRGLNPSIQRDARLGFATPERFALRDHLAGKGVDRDTMVEAGLLIHGDDIPVPYDRFRDRIMFPIHDACGRVIAFGGRAMAKDAQAKYLNSPETPLFHKGACLYNHHRARAAAHRAGTVIAVEGYVDAIMMSVAGFAHTVAPLGTALTEDQLGLLWRMAEEPTLLFDGDGAGRKAAYRAIDIALPQIGPSRTLRFALLPEGQDPDEMIRSAGRAAMDDVLRLAQPLVEMLWMRETQNLDLSTPERRAALERRLREAVSPIRDEATRQHYHSEMRQRLRTLFGGESRPPARRDSNAPWRRGAETPSVVGRATASVKEGAVVRGARTVLPPREALILMALINHPWLMERHCEGLAEIEIENPEAALLRHALMDACAEHVADAGDLRRRLVEGGFARLLGRLDSLAGALHWWVQPDTAPHDVEQGFAHVISLHHKMRTLHRDLRVATAALEQDFTDENFGHLSEIKAQIAVMEGFEATIEGFGASSGRTAQAV